MQNLSLVIAGLKILVLIDLKLILMLMLETVLEASLEQGFIASSNYKKKEELD